MKNKIVIAEVEGNGDFLFSHAKNKISHPNFQWDTSELRRRNIFDLYRGWSLKAAIQDIWNARIDHLKHNLYPDWIKKQFNNSKEK